MQETRVTGRLREVATTRHAKHQAPPSPPDPSFHHCNRLGPRTAWFLEVCLEKSSFPATTHGLPQAGFSPGNLALGLENEKVNKCGYDPVTQTPGLFVCSMIRTRKGLVTVTELLFQHHLMPPSHF